MATEAQDVDSLTQRVIGCAIEVHRELGPGLLESIYREALVIEMGASQLGVETERRVPVRYKSRLLASDLKVDLVVEDCLVIEIKAVERIHPVHLAQVITYLKLTGCPAGLLMNFNATTLMGGLKRLDRPDVYAAKHPTGP